MRTARSTKAHTAAAGVSRCRTEAGMPNVMRQTPCDTGQQLSGEPAIDAVGREVFRLRGLSPAPPPERLASLHNPWSNTAVQANRWAFLDLCQSPAILDGVKDLIGPDVVLWDSQL